MRAGLWTATGLALGLGMVAFAAANDGQAYWEGQSSQRETTIPLADLLKQYDGPIDLAVTGSSQKCIRAREVSGLVLNNREVLYKQEGRLFLNTVSPGCPGFGPGRDGSSVVIPGPSQITFPAGSSTICSGHSVSIDDGYGTGAARCVLGDFVPVEIIGPAEQGAAPAGSP